MAITLTEITIQVLNYRTLLDYIITASPDSVEYARKVAAEMNRGVMTERSITMDKNMKVWDMNGQQTYRMYLMDGIEEEQGVEHRATGSLGYRIYKLGELV